MKVIFKSGEEKSINDRLASVLLKKGLVKKKIIRKLKKEKDEKDIITN